MAPIIMWMMAPSTAGPAKKANVDPAIASCTDIIRWLGEMKVDAM